MKQTFSKGDIDKVALDPTAYFDEPREVISSDILTLQEKRKVLEQWEQDAQRLQESADENMSGGEPAHLAEVRNCLREIE